MSSKKATTPAKPANAAATPSATKPAGAGGKPADDAGDAEGGDEEEVVEKGAAGKASKDMANVTGFMGEEQGALDSSKLGQAMSAITDAKAASSARKARERELEKVVVAKEDLELVMSELDLTKAQADRLLREAKGSVATVLQNVLAISS